MRLINIERKIKVFLYYFNMLRGITRLQNQAGREFSGLTKNCYL